MPECSEFDSSAFSWLLVETSKQGHERGIVLGKSAITQLFNKLIGQKLLFSSRCSQMV